MSSKKNLKPIIDAAIKCIEARRQWTKDQNDQPDPFDTYGDTSTKTFEATAAEESSGDEFENALDELDKLLMESNELKPI